MVESFFGSLKQERIKKQIYKNRQIAEADVRDYIETFYNPSRRHSHLDGVSPEQFETAHRRSKRGVHRIGGTPVSVVAWRFRTVSVAR